MPLVSAVCLWSVAASPCAFVERKEKIVVANVLPIDDVAAVVALHQKPSDLKTTGGAICCGQLRIRLCPLIQLWPLSCSIAYVAWCTLAMLMIPLAWCSLDFNTFISCTSPQELNHASRSICAITSFGS